MLRMWPRTSPKWAEKGPAPFSCTSTSSARYNRGRIFSTGKVLMQFSHTCSPSCTTQNTQEHMNSTASSQGKPRDCDPIGPLQPHTSWQRDNDAGPSPPRLPRHEASTADNACFRPPAIPHATVLAVVAAQARGGRRRLHPFSPHLQHVPGPGPMHAQVAG